VISKGQKDADQPKRRKRKSSKVANHEKQKEGSQQPKTRRKQALPLKGIVLSISTLNDKKGNNTGGEVNYSSAAQLCRDLGAEVLGQVGKRVNYMICTESAVEQATQRVRKAHKKRIPIVNIDWLEKCKQEKTLFSVNDYLMDEQAKVAIESRQKKQDDIANNDHDGGKEVPPDDAGWTEAVSLGCCCVCHENKTAKDCQWCKDLPCAKQ